MGTCHATRAWLLLLFSVALVLVPTLETHAFSVSAGVLDLDIAVRCPVSDTFVHPTGAGVYGLNYHASALPGGDFLIQSMKDVNSLTLWAFSQGGALVWARDDVTFPTFQDFRCVTDGPSDLVNSTQAHVICLGIGAIDLAYYVRYFHASEIGSMAGAINPNLVTLDDMIEGDQNSNPARVVGGDGYAYLSTKRAGTAAGFSVFKAKFSDGTVVSGSSVPPDPLEPQMEFGLCIPAEAGSASGNASSVVGVVVATTIVPSVAKATVHFFDRETMVEVGTPVDVWSNMGSSSFRDSHLWCHVRGDRAFLFREQFIGGSGFTAALQVLAWPSAVTLGTPITLAAVPTGYYVAVGGAGTSFYVTSADATTSQSYLTGLTYDPLSDMLFTSPVTAVPMLSEERHTSAVQSSGVMVIAVRPVDADPQVLRICRPAELVVDAGYCQSFGLSSFSMTCVQHAVDRAFSGDTLVLPAGVWTECSPSIVVLSTLTMRGSDINGTTVIDCEGMSTAIQVQGSGDLTLDRLTIRSGITEEGGGCLLVADATLRLTNVTMANCTAGNKGSNGGGAVLATGSSNLEATDVVFEGCVSATRGGAVDVGATSTASFARVTFVGNRATTSGGALSYTEGVGLEDVAFVANTAGTMGGGMAVRGVVSSVGTFKRLRFESNRAIRGGGIFSMSALHLMDSDLVGNQAIATGGALAAQVSCLSHVVRLTNTNVSFNSARIGGGLALESVSLNVQTGTVIANNDAAADGGGVAITCDPLAVCLDGTARCENVALSIHAAAEIRSNAAGGNGGGINTKNVAMTTVGMPPPETRLVFNNSAVNGGGVFAQADFGSSDDLVLEISDHVADNTATGYGTDRATPGRTIRWVNNDGDAILGAQGQAGQTMCEDGPFTCGLVIRDEYQEAVTTPIILEISATSALSGAWEVVLDSPEFVLVSDGRASLDLVLSYRGSGDLTDDASSTLPPATAIAVNVVVAGSNQTGGIALVVTAEPCGAGYGGVVVHDETFAETRAGCAPCPMGTVSPTSSWLPCVACSNGTFSNVTGLSACLPCPDGEVTADDGASCEEVAAEGLVLDEAWDVLTYIVAAVAAVAAVALGVASVCVDSSGNHGSLVGAVVAIYDLVTDGIFIATLSQVGEAFFAPVKTLIYISAGSLGLSLLANGVAVGVIVRRALRDSAFRGWAKGHPLVLGALCVGGCFNVSILSVMFSATFRADAFAAPQVDGLVDSVRIAGLINVVLEDLPQIGVLVWFLVGADIDLGPVVLFSLVASVLGFAVGLIFRLCVCALRGDGSDSKDNNNDHDNAGGTELEPVHSTDNPVFGE